MPGVEPRIAKAITHYTFFNPFNILFSMVFIAFFFLITAISAAPQSARVRSLPGFTGNFASEHYAGYITIDEDRGRALYYYFVASEGNASSDPLILWLNGGPGCSSFDGFVYEHGPFHFQPGAGPKDMPRLHRNPYTWAKVASIIYLDSPAGVGYSYSNTSSDYTTGDIKTALDAHKFVLKWFELYPEFLARDFYVIGESYAGIYVPNLSQQIVNGIEAGMAPAPKFKGYMIGNGCTDEEFDGNALVPFVFGMSLISLDLFQKVNRACNGNYWNASSEDCVSNLESVHNMIKDINIYDILEPCYHNPGAWKDRMNIRLPSSVRNLGETDRELPIRKRMFGRAWPLRMTTRKGVLSSWRELGHLSCLDVHVADAWMNNPDVRQALHAMPAEVTGGWTICSDRLTYTADSGSMIPIHRNLTSKGYRAHIYSGDHDMCVPHTGSEAWTRSLGYKTITSWYPWYVGGQVAGYSVAYENGLTFTTVKGSGHTVPEYKPKEGLALLQRWLAGSPL